jgi:hypothetical protein
MQIAAAILSGRQRNFSKDASDLACGLRPPLSVEGEIPDPSRSGWLIAVNHYNRPGFGAWWIALAVSVVFPGDIHWIVTSAWTYPDRLRSHLVTPLTQWVLKRLASTYGFTGMPPMPPRDWEAAERARSVRAVLRYVASSDRPIIGLAPEGSDSPDGALKPPPPGIGRFVGILATREFRLLPVGVFEQAGRLCLRFGDSQKLPLIHGEPGARDHQMSEFVMRAIAACLPEHLRGVYT